MALWFFSGQWINDVEKGIEIEYVAADSLKPAPYNPREMTQDALQRLATLIDSHGWVDPIIARREDSLVIGGHQRLKANLIRETPDEKVPVVFLDGVSDEKAKALNIALNNNEAQGDYDYPMLADLLQEIDTGELDIPALTGFSEDDIGKLVHGLDEWQGEEGQEFDESVADDVKMVTCPECEHEFPA